MTADLARSISEALIGRRAVDESILKQINSLNPRDVSPDIKKIMLTALSETNDPRLRNVLAMALADIKSGEAADLITELLNQDKTKGYRGTLLYALQKLGRPLLLLQLIPFILDDTPETQEEAYEMLRASTARSSPDDLEAAIVAVSHGRLRVNDPEKRRLIDDALEILRSYIKKPTPRIHKAL